MSHALPSFARCSFRLACLFVLVAVTLSTGTAAAADGASRDGWDGASVSDEITVWVEAGAGMSAEDFAAAYDTELATALEELLLFLNVDAALQPIQIEVFADAAAYEAAVADIDRIELDGYAAVADAPGARIVVPLDAFRSLTPLDAENQLRHAMAHIVAGWATDFRIPRGFDEGLAQYAERPNLPVQARWAALVQAADQAGTLVSWSNLNRSTPLEEDDTSRAQMYAVVAYLIKHRGLPELWRFFDELKAADNWRTAMNLAFEPATSDQIERRWREDIAAWAAGDWRWNLMTGFDLEPARVQLERGNFAGAAAALEISEQLLRDVNDPARTAEVASLKDLARIGALAETKMAEAQHALEQFLYDRAAAAVAQAEEQYAQLPPEVRPVELIETYKTMAARGMAATNQLEIAHIQAGNWAEYSDTRAAALEAGRAFATLGDETQRDDADRLIDAIDQEQLRIVLLLGSLALLTGGWLVLWLRTRGAPPMRWD